MEYTATLQTNGGEERRIRISQGSRHRTEQLDMQLAGVDDGVNPAPSKVAQTYRTTDQSTEDRMRNKELWGGQSQQSKVFRFRFHRSPLPRRQLTRHKQPSQQPPPTHSLSSINPKLRFPMRRHHATPTSFLWTVLPGRPGLDVPSPRSREGEMTSLYE